MCDMYCLMYICSYCLMYPLMYCLMYTPLYCLQDYAVFSVEISASYTTSGPNNNWHDDLKKAIRYAGEKRKHAVFLFSDAQIVEEGMVGALPCFEP